MSALVATLLLVPFVWGCERDEGPLERAGEQIDETVDDLTHPGEGPFEEAARKTDEAIDRTREKLED